MSEVGPEIPNEEAIVSNDEPQSTNNFGYLREQYTPHRKNAEDILTDSGIEQNTPGFRLARKNTARRFYELEQKGELDQLTGLLNRQGFDRRLQQETARISRQGGKLSALFIDLNNLKLLNDSLGHAKGDELITAAAHILQTESRPYDIVSRPGGDEFIIVLSNSDQEQSKQYWQRVNEKFTAYKAEGIPSISAAAGLSEIDPKHTDESLRLADKAMYKAKKLSKDLHQNAIQSVQDLTDQEILE